MLRYLRKISNSLRRLAPTNVMFLRVRTSSSTEINLGLYMSS